MRLGEWRASAPNKEAASPKVLAVIEQALTALGSERDPECWVAWGDDPGVRYLLFVPTQAGLLQVGVRVAVPGEGPRASGKVVRWSRVQLGELAVEIQGGHRLVTFQLEAHVLTGADAGADAIAAFAQTLFAAVDGRTPAPTVVAARAKKPSSRGSASATAVKRLPAPKGSAR